MNMHHDPAVFGPQYSPSQGETGIDSDALVFIDETPSTADDEDVEKQMPWRILIVDDNEDVHRSTIFALGGETVLGRPLHFHQAYSAADALEVLSKCDGIALVLLDIVMETPNAGFDLARDVRNVLGNKNIRIVVRTGQPGMISDSTAKSSNDINRFLLKSEITQPVLLDVVTSEILQFRELTD